MLLVSLNSLGTGLGKAPLCLVGEGLEQLQATPKPCGARVGNESKDPDRSPHKPETLNPYSRNYDPTPRIP